MVTCRTDGQIKNHWHTQLKHKQDDLNAIIKLNMQIYTE